MSFWDSIFGGMFKKQAKLEDKPVKENHGSSWNTRASGVRNPYPAKLSLDTYGQHGYLYAAISRACEDLSALELKLIKGKGKQAQEIDNHEVLDLLENPSTHSDGFLLREQLCLDLIMSGSCYLLLLGLDEKSPDSIVRLHPAEMRIVTDEASGIVGYEHTSNGQSVLYPVDRVLVARNASYATGPKGLYGTGAIESLSRELQADLNVQNLTSSQSKHGHPDVLISPKDEADVWPAEMRRQIADNYSKLAQAGGCMVLSGQADVTPLNISAKDMEMASVRVMTREVISSVIGTPPAILGLPTSNYASSFNQSKTYWEVQKKRAKRMNILFSQLAKLYDKDLRIEHDFSDIEPLQAQRDAQLQRISMHIMNGMSVADAYAYEGLPSAPVGPRTEPEEEPEEEIIIDDRSEKMILRLLEDQPTPKAYTKEMQAKKWKSWIATKHGPAERKLNRAYAKYLKGAKERYVQRVRKYTEEQETKSIVNGGVVARSVNILNWAEIEATEFEKKKIIQELAYLYEDIYYEIGEEELSKIYDEIGRDTPELNVGDRLRSLINQSAGFIAEATAKNMRKLIEKGNKEGLSKSELLTNVSNSTEFAYPRVQRIGKTEATKTINQSMSNSMDQAGDDGIMVYKQWITQQDNNVRDAHRYFGELDPIPSGEKWEWNDDTSEYPGGFSDMDLVVGCRCTIDSIIVDGQGNETLIT